MKEILKFLNDLSLNNDKKWFTEHKEEYLEAKARFETLTEKLILGISEFDHTCANLTVKDCTYRIYRDVRFSADKSPYKTHFGAYICPGGKKSGYAGYYFHIGTGKGENYPHSHMLAVGDYIYDPKALKIIREDIMNGDGDFDSIIKNDISKKFSFDEEFILKKVPKGFPADSPYSYYLRMKALCLSYTPDTKFMLDKNVVEKSVDLFKTTYPFTQYINRAIKYSKEEL